MLGLLRSYVTLSHIFRYLVLAHIHYIYVFRRLGTSLAHHRASLSSDLGSLWDFFRIDKERRRSTQTYEPIESRSPVKLARDLLQVVQETVFSKKFEEKRCPLVKEESDLSSDEEEGTDRVANLIDFFFTIVKSQKDDRRGSCFKTEASKEEIYIPAKVNTELEQKMETLIEFLASTGVEENNDKKITLMEFLFGPDDKWEKPKIEIHMKGMSLSESDINVKNLSYIDETPVEESETLVEMLLKYMEHYGIEKSLTPSLSEKSKSDMTISKYESSDLSKTKSDSTLLTQDTVIERDRSRRISETVVDMSYIKSDLEDIFEEAILRVCELQMMEDDTMSEQEDVDNYNTYTKPPQYSLPYSIELSDILEEDETSGLDRISIQAKECAEELMKFIEDKLQKHFDDSSGPSTEEFSREFDLSPSQKSQSLVDLRNIPDLPPSLIIKPKVIRVDKSTSTSEDSIDRKTDSSSMIEDKSERTERVLDKLESLHRFFSRSRLEIIDESLEDDRKSPKGRKHYASLDDVEDLAEDNDRNSLKGKKFQASLDDVEDLAEDNDRNSPKGKKFQASLDDVEDLAEDNDRNSPKGKKFQASLDDVEDLAEDNDRKSPKGKKFQPNLDDVEDLAEDNDRKSPRGKNLQARLDDVEDLAEDNDRINDVDKI
ncbi:unnamed protein product [Pieris macdunnoughi]|uniref:Uncharacterized protein n=1 Tax=Pieris macdunnoughi TaxID=345717 RepID=A0A821XB22_9NEOP|nr:unnamed protein product [Pieris macdunnoughi]